MNKPGVLILSLLGFVAQIAPIAVSAEQSMLEKALQGHVAKIVNDFPRRDFSQPAVLERLAKYLKAELSVPGATTRLQTFAVDGNSYSNVIAQFGPSSGEQIVIGAHYDVADGLPGADDNASGVAALIELAKHLSTNRPGKGIQLVAYVLEEPPYFATDQMGSAFHARLLREANTPLQAMISLEMLGYFTEAPNSQTYPSPELKARFPSVGNFIAVVGKLGDERITSCIASAMRTEPGLAVENFNGPPTLEGVAHSDHLSYWRAGFPAVMITDTAFFRNKYYHTADDTPDKLNYKKMAQVTSGVMRAIDALMLGCDQITVAPDELRKDN